MTLKIPRTNYDNIILFDIEYDQMSLVQFAALFFRKQEENTFKLIKSINLYVKQDKSLNPFFIKYTNITDEFLMEKGVERPKFLTLFNDFVEGCTKANTTIIGHGVKNDLLILQKNDCNLVDYGTPFCTYENAKRILQRNDKLTVYDLALESGYHIFNAHNAYADVWGTLNVFCYLKELENENS